MTWSVKDSFVLVDEVSCLGEMNETREAKQLDAAFKIAGFATC